MEEEMIYELLKNNICVQEKALKKLIWVLYRNFYFNSSIKQNILLIGERGTGKTTMLKEVAELMDIPLGEVYNMFMPDGLNASLFLNGMMQIAYNSDEYNGNGILLLHDFQDCFLYGHSISFNAMMASGLANFGDEGFFDISNITLVGEIDTNNVKDIFIGDISDLSNIDNNEFLSPTLNIVKKYLTDENKIIEYEDGSKAANVGLENYITNQIKLRFLSSNCNQLFKQKIYMDDMGAEEILKALYSPLSVLNLYKNDLTEDYINSEDFKKKVASLVSESGDGLHYAGMAIEQVFKRDYKHGVKVLKKKSLFSDR